MKGIIEPLIDNVSSYNIFNYFFPGVVFLASPELATAQSLPQYNLVVYLFVAYFTCNRVIQKYSFICKV